MSSDVPDNGSGAHSPHEPAGSDDAPPDDVCVLSPQLRAALKHDITPTALDRARVRSELWSTLAGPGFPAGLQQVEESMAAHAAGVKRAAFAVRRAWVAKALPPALAVLAAISVASTLLPRAATERARSAPVARPPALTTASRPAVTQSFGAGEEPVQKPDTTPPPTAAITPVFAGPHSAAQTRTTRGERPKAQRSTPTPASFAAPLSVVESPAIRTQPELPTPPNDATGLGVGAQVDVPVVIPPALTAATANPLTAASARPAIAATTPSTPNVEGAGGTLAQELALVQAAFNALDRQQSATVLELTSRYFAHYPQGALIIEAESLRALSLCQGGRDGATAERDRFLQRHGASALAERVRRACRKSL